MHVWATPVPCEGKVQVRCHVSACAVASVLLHLASSYTSFKTYPRCHPFQEVSLNHQLASGTSIAVVLNRADFVPEGILDNV